MLEPCVRVEHVEVSRRVEQHLMFVLTMEIDERARQLAERDVGDERAVDERAAPALRRDLTPDDDFSTVWCIEDRFNRR